MNHSSEAVPKVPVELVAPLGGEVYPITEVPDPVFSQKLVGDGISIDPVTDRLLAPIQGVVSFIHPSGHALTIQAGPYEVMMHIGLETVGLKGEGFSVKVKKGDQVEVGQELIQFDMDVVGRKAKSLMTQILVVSGQPIAIELNRGKIAALDKAMRIHPEGIQGAQQKERQAPEAGHEAKAEASIQNPTGIHARPAAALVTQLKMIDASVDVILGEKKANAKSIVSLMSLELEQGDRCTIVGRGPEATRAVNVIKSALEAIHDEEGEHEAPPPASSPGPGASVAGDKNTLMGPVTSKGLAFGSIYQLTVGEVDVAEFGGLKEEERHLFVQALKDAQKELTDLEQGFSKDNSNPRGAIFAAHREIMEDPEIIADVEELLDEGKSAAYAWRTVYHHHAGQLESLNNELLAARANDLRDVGRRILRLITNSDEPDWNIPDHAIVIAQDLTPSDVAKLGGPEVVGFVTTTGGPTSHVAILAKSMGIPAIAGMEQRALDIPNGTEAILFGDEGRLALHPSSLEIEDVLQGIEKQRSLEQAALGRAGEPAVSKDGEAFQVFANIGTVADSREAPRRGAEGVGLLRSEFLFLHRDKEPTIDEQASIYGEIAKHLGAERPLVVRTLDVGGDKPLPYISFPEEDNPFLGVRGIRIGQKDPTIIERQIRAICRANHMDSISVMFPMVTFVDEIKSLKQLVAKVCDEEGRKPLKVGMMVEVPSAALQAEVFAQEVDFFSIGTNDLAQYTLATDRTHRDLAKTVDSLNPAVLSLISIATKGAHKYGKEVAVCGGIASDLDAVPILMGLGVDEFSVSLPMVAHVKDEIRTFNLSDCQALAQKALGLSTGNEVRQLAKEFRRL